MRVGSEKGDAGEVGSERGGDAGQNTHQKSNNIRTYSSKTDTHNVHRKLTNLSTEKCTNKFLGD